MTSQEQLDAWVRGESKCPNDRGECCPDFSCCCPKLLAPPEVRRAFAAASPAEREGMLMGFLGGAIAAENANVYVTGGRKGIGN